METWQENEFANYHIEWSNHSPDDVIKNFKKQTPLKIN